MGRKSDTNTEKLDPLYAKRAFLKTKYQLQGETTDRTKLTKHREAQLRTFQELEENQAEIDKFLDADI